MLQAAKSRSSSPQVVITLTNVHLSLLLDWRQFSDMIPALCIWRKKTLKKTFVAMFFPHSGKKHPKHRLKLEADVWRGSTVLQRFMNTTYYGKRCGLSSYATQMIVICIYISTILVKTLLVLEYGS